jgi:hypothetical protein
MLFTKICGHFPKPRTVKLFREPIHCVDTDRYLGVTLQTLLTWLPHIEQKRKEVAQKLGGCFLS